MPSLDEMIDRLRRGDPPIEVDLRLDFHSRLLGEIHEYWLSKCAGRTMPDRRNLDPTELGRLLPYVSLFDVSHTVDGIALFPRLAGQELERVMGSIHMRPLGETLAPDIVSRWCSMVALVYAWKAPVRTTGVVHHHEKHFIHSEVYIAPLAHDGLDMSMVLVGTVFTIPKS